MPVLSYCRHPDCETLTPDGVFLCPVHLHPKAHDRSGKKQAVYYRWMPAEPVQPPRMSKWGRGSSARRAANFQRSARGSR